jgi:hypothetical protein
MNFKAIEIRFNKELEGDLMNYFNNLYFNFVKNISSFENETKDGFDGKNSLFFLIIL